MVALTIPNPTHDGPLTSNSILLSTLNLRTTAFIFLNLQSSHLDLLPRSEAHDLLMSIFILRDQLDQRQGRPVVVHVVSLPLTPTGCCAPHFPPSTAPREGEPVLAKPGLSGWHHTALERHLRERRVERLYLCGASKGGEMVATALAGRDLLPGGQVWVVEDCWREVEEEVHDAAGDLLAGLDMLVDGGYIASLREEVEEDDGRGGGRDESAVRRELERREPKREERERKEQRFEREGAGLGRHNVIVRGQSPRPEQVTFDCAEMGEVERPRSRGALLLRGKKSAQSLRFDV